jgi:glycosyltransferase involved in cell wall biosynthesis
MLGSELVSKNPQGTIMKKNILFVVHNLKIGGIQTVTLDTARHHVKQGNSVTILTLSNEIELDIDFECRLESLSITGAFLKMPLLALYFVIYKTILRKILPKSDFIWATALYGPLFSKFLQSNANFDAVFINGARSMHHLSNAKHDNLSYSLHLPHDFCADSNDSIYHRFLFKRLFSNKKIFTVSNFIREQIQVKAEALGVDIKSIKTIYNPCDIERIERLSSEPIDIDYPYILAVGRLTKQKRFDRLIDAYKQSGVDKKLVIVGDGNQRGNMESQIKRLGLDDKIVLVGYDKNPYKWMASADLFVLSSDVEGFVLVVNEALACGTPVVATDCGPITEILKGDLSSGISKMSADSLAEKIKLYTESPVYPSPDDIASLSFDRIIEQQMKIATGN